MRTKTGPHPGWCGQGHVCTADMPEGEHRSHPMSADTHAGRVVLTRVRTRRGQERIEVRASVDLPADQALARREAQALMLRLLTAVRSTAH